MGLTFNIKTICSLSGLLKVVEIILAFICLALLRHYGLNFGPGVDRQLVGIIALGCSVLIALPLLVGYIFFDVASNLLEALFCFTAGTMNLAGGALAIEHYHNYDHTESVRAILGMASLMIINALVFFIDAGTGTLRSTK